MIAALKLALQPKDVLKTALSGFVMGIANIIPGISGGTIIFALGLYPKFIEAIADLTRLKFRLSNLVFLGILFGMSMLSLAIFAGLITAGLERFHHVLFALFVGLTLGGVPILFREIKPIQPVAIGAAIIGLLLMVGIALADPSNLPQNFIVFLLVGVIASSAMVLPGISGSYLLLLMGLYYPITSSIKNFVYAVKDANFGEAFDIGLKVLLPVGLGVVVGIVALANILKFALERYHQATLGFLLGLLVGSVIGIWPFSELRDKEEVIAAAHPITPLNVILVLVFIVAGFFITVAVGRLGNGKK